MNTPNEKDEQFAKEAKARFDESVDRLDAATLSKLNQGRQAALAEIRESGGTPAWLRWAPATGIAAAALVVVVMLQNTTPGGVDVDPFNSAATDFEILLEDESLDMIEELEFYSWIEYADLDSPDNVG